MSAFQVHQPEVVAMVMATVEEVLACDATVYTHVSSAIDGLAAYIIRAILLLLLSA